MLKKYNQPFIWTLYVSDFCAAAVSWLLAYYLRFYGPGLVYSEAPPIDWYIATAPVLALILSASYRFFGLYDTRYMNSARMEAKKVLKASLAASLMFLGLVFVYGLFNCSRAVFVIFLSINFVLMESSRAFLKAALKHLRSRGYYSRKALVIGAGPLGKRVGREIRKSVMNGMDLVGYVDDGIPAGTLVAGRPVLGRVDETRDILEKMGINEVFVAFTYSDLGKLPYILRKLKNSTANIRVVPDIYWADTLNAGVEKFNSLLMVNLVESPMCGWGEVAKRMADISVSLVALTITAPVMLAIALLIKATSPGPVFFRQKRMGLDGNVFEMLKFRSMREDAEKETGAVWAKQDDPRATPIGAFLRKTSMDELPQFFNVMMGEMSVVGPRPERPHFINQFKDRIPKYMLRHKVKAGITGWAQVNGYRGNTSLVKRIRLDLYYIENWSIVFDLKIIWLTVFRGFTDKNSY